MQTMRLQKYLAERGIASRRRAEAMIREGRVSVNGVTVTGTGIPVSPEIDCVCVDGAPVSREREPLRTVLLHKPRGYVCSASEETGPSVLRLLHGVRERLVPVGRLDKNSEGLLLLSNDGDLTLRLTHPRYEKAKTYRVTVSGFVGEDTLRLLRKPILIGEYRTQPAQVRHAGRSTQPGRDILEIVLKEGRNRQIRRLCDSAGLTVHRLVRTHIGSLELRGLRIGQWRELSEGEVEDLARRPTGGAGIRPGKSSEQ